MMKIMRISRFRMGLDGEGITTLVAFADCPLNCKYCINDFCHKTSGSKYSVPVAEYEIGELVEVLKKDDIYYKMSNGGITFGGGEPLLYCGFIKRVCRYADDDWNIRIETSLNDSWSSVSFLIRTIDEWIIDIKDMNPDIYKAYTGREQDQMIYNLQRLLKTVSPDKILVRVPHIPDFNTKEDVEASKERLINMGVTRIDEFTYTM